jgi:tungstate transport system ATP-binding protein
MLPLELDQLTFSAGNAAIIRGISARIEAGPRSVILGPNGAGKSVLMRLCHGLLTPTGGRIVWHGARNGGKSVDVRRHQAMVFQRPVMLRRSALANVMYGLKLAGKSRSQSELRAMDVLEVVGLAQHAARAARVLSGGEQQRLALARALARDPDLLLLDEPTANLDPAATRSLEEVVREAAHSGIKVVMASHDLGQVRRLGGRVLFLVRGKVREHTDTQSFLNMPKTAEAAAFVRGDLVV